MKELVLPYPREHLATLYQLPDSKLAKYGGRFHVEMRRLGAKSPSERPWVARIGVGGKLEFLRGTTDYENADELGETGVVVRWILPPGKYRVFDWINGKRTITVEGEQQCD